MPVAVPTTTLSEQTTCASLISRLPTTIAGKAARAVTPRTALAKAWGDPAVVVRCGVGRPAELRETSVLLEIDALTWFEIYDDDTRSHYVALDRRPYVEVSLPRGIGADNVLVPLGRVVASLPNASVDLHP